MKKYILVTGVNGFLGRALFNFLKKKTSHNIIGLDIKTSHAHANIFRCDLCDLKKTKKKINAIRPDIIFHCAGARGNVTQGALNSNIQTTKILFSAIREIKGYFPRVVVPGSAAEYGRPGTRIRKFNESMRAKPTSMYGKIKFKQTTLALKQAESKYDVVIGRVFNILGENTPPELVAGRFAQQIAQMKKQKVSNRLYIGNLNGKRDFIDIEDVCRALWAIARRGKSGEIYNICSGSATKIRDLLRDFIQASSCRHIEVQENSGKKSNSFDAIGSNIKINRVTNWTPRISLKRSIQKTLASYRI